jgi:RimJ/RimL family protein N-acetyltransferase
VTSAYRSSYLVFRRDSAKPITSNYVLPDGYTTASWKLGLLLTVPSSPLSRWKVAVLGIMFILLGRSPRYTVYVISAPDGSPAHYSVLFPKYFRFPFMGKSDLQIGGLWTNPSLRCLGLATYAVQEILRAEEQPERVYWYVVAENNVPSVRVAEKNGFIAHGFASRRRHLGSSWLARFELMEVSS